MSKHKKSANDRTYIATRLRRSRKMAGFESAEAFASHYNINPSTYRHHESGHIIPHDITFANYARLLNVSLEWLITGNKDLLGKPFLSHSLFSICSAHGNETSPSEITA